MWACRLRGPCCYQCGESFCTINGHIWRAFLSVQLVLDIGPWLGWGGLTVLREAAVGGGWGDPPRVWFVVTDCPAAWSLPPAGSLPNPPSWETSLSNFFSLVSTPPSIGHTIPTKCVASLNQTFPLQTITVLSPKDKWKGLLGSK